MVPEFLHTSTTSIRRRTHHFVEVLRLEDVDRCEGEFSRRIVSGRFSIHVLRSIANEALELSFSLRVTSTSCC